MKTVSLVLATFAASTAFAGSLQSTSVGKCADVKWKPEAVQKYPDIAKSCIDVVERDGKKYVKLAGKVTRKGNDSVTVMLDGSKSSMTWKPASGELVSIEGQDIPAMDVVVEQKLRFYMPLDQVATM